jgi:cyanophycin synthetase
VEKQRKNLLKCLEAIKFAVKNAVKGSLIVLCSDVIPDALELVQQLKEQESKGELELR